MKLLICLKIIWEHHHFFHNLYGKDREREKKKTKNESFFGSHCSRKFRAWLCIYTKYVVYITCMNLILTVEKEKEKKKRNYILIKD